MLEQKIKDTTRFITSFEAFLKECLGYRENKALEYVDLTPTHNDLINFLQFDEHRFKLLLMPRYSFKSEIITSAYALWNLVRNPNLRILIYSDSGMKASGFLATIKNHIEGQAPNSRFRDYFPSWETDPQRGKWNESQIIIRTRKVALREPSIDTAGIETSRVGMHYDMIFFDDIVSDLNVTTKAQMDKVYDCYKKSLSLLKPTGSVTVVGTRWHFGDAYGRMIAENRGEFGLFIKKATEKGLEGDVFPFESIGLTKEFLDQQRAKQGSYLTSCIYQNEPVDDETAVFKHEHFSFYKEVDSKQLFITCTCDPAGEGEDYTGITVVGTDKDLNMYILDVVNKHLQPNQIVDQIIKLNYRWNFDKLGIETNFFRGLLEKEIKLAVDVERKNKNFKLFSTEIFKSTAKRGESKDIRIRSLQPYHERGALRFKGERVETLTGAFSELAFQMLQFPKATHDDIIDSLAWHVNLIRPGGKVEANKPHPQSPAGLELAEFERCMQMNKHLPRQFRKKFQLSLQ